MNAAHKPVPPEKQLTVIARVEPGSLGPDGMDKVEDFCRFANQNMATDGQRYTRWQIISTLRQNLAGNGILHSAQKAQ